MHNNSLQVWFNNVKPELTEREQDVLQKLIELGPSTCEEVAKAMGRYPNQISGRFTRLTEKGKIVSEGTKLVNGRPHAIHKINADV